MLTVALAKSFYAHIRNGRYVHSTWRSAGHVRSNVRPSDWDNLHEQTTDGPSQREHYREEGQATADNLPPAVRRFVDAYRIHGHKIAAIDPLGLWVPMRDVPELNPSVYGLTSDVEVNGYLNLGRRTSMSNLVQALHQTYSSKLSVEFEYLIYQEERQWFAQRFEQLVLEIIPVEVKKQVGKILLQTAVFDSFLASKFPTLKRYGARGEGAEGNLFFMDETLRLAFAGDYHDVVACMPHRGRLNVLTVNLGYDPSYMFQKINGKSEFPDDVKATGDVLSHLFTSVDLTENGKKLHVSLIPNPSHLEANNPVAVGKARGRQQSLKAGYYGTKQENDKKVLCVQIHGDASFAGQGIIAETFGFADLPHYSVGGSVHLITNNQVGFTTTTGRSSMYASDIAKINSCPVIHVNGESPEDIIRATKLAFEYRERFGKDIVIDLLCYRLHGHNEVDDPTMTQPVMYNAIKSRKSVPVLYNKFLMKDGHITEEESRKISEEYDGSLRQALSQLDQFKPKAHHLERQWSGLVQASRVISTWDTGFPIDALKFIGSKSVQVPDSFNGHPHLLKTHVKTRLERVKEGNKVDWATAEVLAMGSLLMQGFDVRLSGQDVGRGTFSHRHAALTDNRSNELYVPLNNLMDKQDTHLEICNSTLSEEAVLGFEYGMSIDNPNRLVIWEAQFGDFFTGAQIIIDTYITSGETKWLLQSGLVMLLPHGYDGAGPEHSSCRIERFLQQTDSSETKVDADDVNFSFVNATTPAQYFHVLRRQMIRNFRKPLVMAAPKTVLRLPAATSELLDMAPGTFFQPVLPDSSANADTVDKVIFVSGKHYYTLDKVRQEEKKQNVALVRIEELCPFPTESILKESKKYPKAKSFVWSQEEPRNMGAWAFVTPRFRNLVGLELKYAGPQELPVTAVAIGHVHQQQVKDTIKQTFE